MPKVCWSEKASKKVCNVRGNFLKNILQPMGCVDRRGWLLLVIAEAGYRFGYKLHCKKTDGQSSSVQGAVRNQVPGAIWTLLLVLAACGAWASGYGGGTASIRSSFNQYAFPILIAVVITLITDIAQPRKGLVSIDREPLTDLLESMKP